MSLTGPSFAARAVLIGERIDLRPFRAERLASTPTVARVGPRGVAVVFRYGVVVFFGAEPADERKFLELLAPHVSQPAAEEERETVRIVVAPDAEEEGMTDSEICLRDVELTRLQLVAEVLAKSVVLASFESRVTQTFDRIEPVAGELERTGRVRRRARALLSHLGETLLTEYRVVGRAEVIDKPETLWERPELEGLYLRLEDEFELRERHLLLERKLELISRTASSVLDLIHTRATLRVEWFIVILIVVEIVLALVGA